MQLNKKSLARLKKMPNYSEIDRVIGVSREAISKYAKTGEIMDERVKQINEAFGLNLTGKPSIRRKMVRLCTRCKSEIEA